MSAKALNPAEIKALAIQFAKHRGKCRSFGRSYTPSPRVYRPPEDPEYPFHDRTVRITHCGRICIGSRKINLSRAFAGQFVGIREVGDKIWLVSFMEFDLGYFDEEESRVEPAVNPFLPRVLPMSPV
jgi:hypothetical protein